MAITLKLNRGASYTTINLNDQTNYKVPDTWNPRIATRKVSRFGGLPYNDVAESIPLYIKGSTAAVVLEKVEDIIAAMEQAYAWKLGAVVDPVLLEYLPQGSSLGAVVQAAVLGTPSDAANMLELAQLAMYMTGNSFETMLSIPLVRRGLWLGAAETPIASSSVANPGKMSVTFANSVRIPSPAKLVFDDKTGVGAGSPGPHTGFLLTADQSDKLAFLESSAMNPYQGIGIWDTIVDTGASGGSYRRVDKSSSPTGIGGTITMNANAQTFAIYASMRNTSATFSWTIQPILNTLLGRPVILEPDAAGAPYLYPRIVFCGFMSELQAITSVNLLTSSSDTNDTLEIDWIIVQAFDENTGAVVFDTTSNIAYGMDEFTLNPQVLTSPQGILTFQLSSTVYHVARRAGELYINSVGTNLTAMLVGVGLGSAAWRLTNPGTGAITFSMTATRYPGYLVVR